MKLAFVTILTSISLSLLSQSDSIRLATHDMSQFKVKCDKEEITSVRTNRRGTKKIIKGVCYSIVGYYTYMDPPPPKYGNGIRFRRVELILD